MRTHRPGSAPVSRSAFAGFRFSSDVIVVAVRWYLRFGLSYRDVEELLAERGVEVNHVTIYRWVMRFTSLLAEAARPCRHAVGDRWQVDETYVKVAGQWRYVYRAIDQFGQVIDVFVSPQRDAKAAHRFFQRAIVPTSTPTTASSAITAASKRGCGRCAGSSRTAAPWSSSPDMPSSRTFGEDTTNWPSRNRPIGGWRSHSTNSRSPSETGGSPRL